MPFILEVRHTQVVDTLAEARALGGAVNQLLQEPRAARIFAPQEKPARYVSVAPETFDRSKVLRNEQGAHGQVATIAKKFNELTGAAPELFKGAVKVDEVTREVSPDYGDMVKTIKSIFPGDASKLELFKAVVAQQLASQVLPGHLFK